MTGPVVAHQPARVHAVGRDHPGGGRLQVGRGEAPGGAPLQTVDHGAAQAVGPSQDLGGLAHVTVLQAPADPGRGPAAALPGADLGQDLDLNAPRPARSSGARRRPRRCRARHVVAHDDGLCPRSPPATCGRTPAGSVRKARVVGDDRDGVQPGVPSETRRSVRRSPAAGHGRAGGPDGGGGRRSQRRPAGGRPVPAWRARRTTRARTAWCPRCTPSKTPMVTTLPGPGRPQTCGHLLGAVPDLHRGQSCSRSTQACRSCGSTCHAPQEPL